MSGSGQLFETDGGPGSGRLVVKLFPWAAGLAEGVVQDFTGDALTVASLRHPHVVQITDAGRFGDGTPYVVMERLRGRTLAEAADGGALARPELLAILRGVASALATAHAAGVVHGEVRADNIFMTEVAGYARGFPKLLDFGVAHLTSDAALADERADQLALAALASRLLAPTDATPAARQVLARALSGNPSQRFDSVASFFQALERALTEGSTPPALVEATASAPQPSSLTQQFFADGERQELAHAESGSPKDGEDAPAVSGAFDRVPRSRARMFAAASLALTSVAVLSWTVASLSRAHDPAASLSMASPHEAPVAPPVAPAPAPAPAQARAAVGRARVARVAGRPHAPRTEPTPFVAMVPPTPVNSTAAAPAPGTPAPTPAPAPDSPPPAAAPAAPQTDEDFTQPWEQTEGAPPEAAPVTAEPLAP